MAGELRDDVGLDLASGPELEEILYAVRPHIHEGRAPSYGALVLRRKANVSRNVSGPTAAKPDRDWRDLEVEDLDVSRLYADGQASFLVRGSNSNRLRLFGSPVGDELSLARRARAGWTVVQRTAGGQVRIYRRNRIISRDAASKWWSKPSAALYLSGLRSSVGPSRDLRLAKSILELCVHQLSAAGVGATIVQPTAGAGEVQTTDSTHACSPPGELSVEDAAVHPAIRSALSQTDRAAIVTRSGRLAEIGVTLLPGARDRETDPAEGGTRHNSAKVFSAAEPQCLVYVVSSDGPVSVFRDGRALVSTEGFVNIESEERECPACGNTQFDYDRDGPGGEIFVSSNEDCEVCSGTGSVTQSYSVVVPHRW